MGGPGSGGRRAGAGHPRGRGATYSNGSGAGAAGAAGANDDAGDVAPPDNLTLAQLAVWQDLAPLAIEEGTLTRATAQAFRDLCEAIVLKSTLLRQAENDGLVLHGPQGKKAHPLLSQYRGLMQRVEAGLSRFNLAPAGKPAKPKGLEGDLFSEFEDPPAPLHLAGGRES
jgi:hypothetical protein